MSRYSKLIAAVVAGLGVAVSVTTDDHMSLNDWFAIAFAAVGALTVYAVPNTPPEPPKE